MYSEFILSPMGTTTPPQVAPVVIPVAFQRTSDLDSSLFQGSLEYRPIWDELTFSFRPAPLGYIDDIFGGGWFALQDDDAANTNDAQSPDFPANIALDCNQSQSPASPTSVASEIPSLLESPRRPFTELPSVSRSVASPCIENECGDDKPVILYEDEDPPSNSSIADDKSDVGYRSKSSRIGSKCVNSGVRKKERRGYKPYTRAVYFRCEVNGCSHMSESICVRERHRGVHFDSRFACPHCTDSITGTPKMFARGDAVIRHLHKIHHIKHVGKHDNYAIRPKEWETDPSILWSNN